MQMGEIISLAMKKPIASLVVFLALVFGQNAEPRFEVASVRRSSIDSRSTTRIEIGDGRVILTNALLHMIIQEAYGLSSSQQRALGLGQLMLSPFDIQAKAERSAGPVDLRLMLRALLGDRFRMQSHFEQQVIPGLVMTIARGGLKLKTAAAEDPVEPPHFTADEFRGENVSLEEIAAAVANGLYTPTEDRTATNGRFTFSVQFRPGVRSRRDEAVNAIGLALGLRFVEANVNTRLLVIDHIEAPSEN